MENMSTFLIPISDLSSALGTVKSLKPGSTVLIGLSGGPDSVFLLHFLLPFHRRGEIALIAAHLDHGWRAESPKDVQFCQELAHTLEIPFVAGHAKEFDFFKANGSKEEIGRNMRRAFFEKMRQHYKADYIALAHHAHDQQETFFIRLFRGASLSGLKGMKRHEGYYIRPLLSLHKGDIIAYLHEHTIPYLVDASNNSPLFLRNRIRADILPVMHTTDPRWNKNFATTITKLQETEQFLEKLTHEYFIKIRTQEEYATYCIDIAALKNIDSFMQQRIIIYWLYLEKVSFNLTEKFIQEIMRFLHAPQGGEHVLAKSWSIKKIKCRAYVVKRNAL